MTAQRDIRVWDSSVIIAYLGNEIAYRDVLLSLIEQAERGALTVVVSSLATVEVAYVGGLDSDAAEGIISDFFANNYIVPAAIDPTTLLPMRVASYGNMGTAFGLRPFRCHASWQRLSHSTSPLSKLWTQIYFALMASRANLQSELGNRHLRVSDCGKQSRQRLFFATPSRYTSLYARRAVHVRFAHTPERKGDDS